MANARHMTPRHNWSPEHDPIIRERYPQEGASPALIKLFGCTDRQLHSRAQTLGAKFERKKERVIASSPSPPKPTTATRNMFGIRSGRPLTPVAPEVERAAIDAWLARNQPTQCPTAWAWGADFIQTVGKQRMRG